MDAQAPTTVTHTRTPQATTAQRGYGSKHQRLRKQYESLVRSGRATCWRCGTPIAPDAKWDLGHNDHDRSRYMGPEHIGRECPAGGNRATSTRRRQRQHQQTASRRW